MNKKLQLLALGTLFGLASMSAQTVVVSSGNPAKKTAGSTIFRKPMSNYYGYERAAYIYKQSEIGAIGNISQISFYCDSINSPATVPVKVYIKEITASSFAANTNVATEETGATLVYNGTLASGTFVKGWINLTLPVPFLYTSAANNLEVIVESNGGGTGVEGSLSKGFRYDSLTTTNMQYWQQDNTPPTGTGSLTNYRQNIQLVLSPNIACAGTPTSGTATANATTLCYNDSTSLNLTGSTIGSGITIQWQSSLNGTTWTNITGATTALYNTPPLTVSTYYQAVVTCANGGASATSASVLVNVNAPLATPYVEDFESITANNQLPSCMEATNLSTYTRTYIAPTGSYQQKNHTAGGSKFASFRYGCDDYFFTPALALTAGQSYQFSFWYATDGLSGWNTLAAKLGTNATPAGMTTIIGSSITNPIDTAYTQFTGTFTAPTTGVYNIGIYCNSTSNPYYLSIDDINLIALSGCSGTPTSGTVTGNATLCYNDSTNLSLIGSTLATGITYQWQSSLNGTTWANVTGGIGATTTNYNTPRLTVNTYFRAIVTCTTSATSSMSASFLVSVSSPAALPYTEDFESIVNDNDLPSCMQATNLNNETYTYIAPTGSNEQKNHTAGGTKFASFKYNSDDYFFTPAFNLTAGQSYRFSFWYITDGYTGWDTLAAKFGTSATPSAMTTVIGTELHSLTDTVYKRFTGTFIPPTTGIYNIGIYCNATFSPEYLSIDDINLTQLPSCTGTPTSGSVTGTASVCYKDSTILTLAGSSQASGLTYQWQSSPNGTTWTNVTGANTTMYNTPTLTTSTYYRTVVTCTITATSATTTAFFVNVTAPLNLPYSEDFESLHTNNQLPNCMEATNLNSETFTYIAPTGSYEQKNHTAGGSRYASFYYNCDDYFFTPALNLSAGQSYQFSFWYITDGYNGWDTLAAKIGTAQNATAMTSIIGTELHNVSDTTYKQFVGTFTVSANGTYNIGIYCKSNYTPYYLSIDDINLVQLLPCAGTPTSGTTTASVDSTCTTVDLGTIGSSPAAQGLTYQWQSSSNGTTWANIPGATSVYYTATLSASTYYRLELTCSGQTSSSTPKFVKLNTALYCYCNSGLGGGCSSTAGAIDSVAITNTTLQNGPTGCTPSYFTQYPATGNTTAILAPGTTYTFNVKFTGSSIGSVWVDYNQNGTFEANSTEWKQICLTSTPGLNYTVALNVPANAVLGNTIMRVRARDAGNTNDSTSGCLSFGSGETEDYIVTIGTPLGINSYKTFSSNLDVYPNPSMGKVNLHYTNAKNETISLSVLNVDGQQVYTEQISDKGDVTKTIDLSNCTNGVYFIRLISGNEVIIRKVVKQQ